MLDYEISKAKKEGTYDEGIMALLGTDVFLTAEPRVAYRDASSGATALLYRVMVDRGTPFELACRIR